MQYILLLMLASMVIVHILSQKEMRAALVAYLLVYVFIVTLWALVVGVSIYADNIVRPDIMDLDEVLSRSFAEAVAFLGITSVQGLIVMISSSLALALILLCCALLCGKELCLAIQKHIIANKLPYRKIPKSTGKVRVIPADEDCKHCKVWLRLCRMNN